MGHNIGHKGAHKMTEQFDPYHHPKTHSTEWWSRYIRMARDGTDAARIAFIAEREDRIAGDYAALERVPFTGTAKVEKVCPRAQGHGCVSYCGVDMTDFCSVTGRRV